MRRHLFYLYLTISLIGCSDSAPSSSGSNSSSANIDNSHTVEYNTATATADEGEVLLSGEITYTRYLPDGENGLDYNAPVYLPVRGAVIELWDKNDEVISSTNSTDGGKYSFSVAKKSQVTVVFKAVLGHPKSPTVEVVDNTQGEAIYALARSIYMPIDDIKNFNINAESGWSENGYTATREAAPFAILDDIYTAQQRILTIDPTLRFPLLQVNWSSENNGSSGAVSNGDIGTSYYDPASKKFYILGAADSDTDEYDSAVVIHEWFHYFEDNFSRTDSLGGEHGERDILDPSVAFSEAYCNALSSIVRDDSTYIDTYGRQQGSTAIYMNMDEDSVSDSSSHRKGLRYDGFYSESSIQEVIYDLYDGGGSSDDDNLELGLRPLHLAIVKQQKTTPAFTSIFSFLQALKEDNSGVAGEIERIASDENITAHDEYEAIATPLYTDIEIDSGDVTEDILGDPLQTWSTYGAISGDDPGNKLYNRLFFRFTPQRNGCHTITATPTDRSGDLLIYLTDSLVVDDDFGQSEKAVVDLKAYQATTFAVGSYDRATPFTVRVDSGGNC
ncbi:MAG: hypothetical protein HQL49_04450 [Gammaproteobacteria bacterium]|nr:hypothetical protein [Gammaproteobacteria bacterium]